MWGQNPAEARDVRPIYDQVEKDHWGELEGGQLLTGRMLEGVGEVWEGLWREAGIVSMQESEIICVLIIVLIFSCKVLIIVFFLFCCDFCLISMFPVIMRECIKN